MRNPQLCAQVCGDEATIGEFFPWVLVANKTQELRFQYRDEAQRILDLYQAGTDFGYYATLEWRTDK